MNDQLVDVPHHHEAAHPQVLSQFLHHGVVRITQYGQALPGANEQALRQTHHTTLPLQQHGIHERQITGQIQHLQGGALWGLRARSAVDVVVQTQQDQGTTLLHGDRHGLIHLRHAAAYPAPLALAGAPAALEV